MRWPEWVYDNQLYHPYPFSASPLSGRAVEQHGANVANRFGRIQSLGTHVDAVLNAVATKHAEGVIQLSQAVVCRCIATVSEESVGLQQSRRAHEPIGVPPERRAAGRATGTKNALIQAVQLRPFLWRLQTFDGRRWRRILKVGLYLFILRVKEAHIDDKVADNG